MSGVDSIPPQLPSGVQSAPVALEYGHGLYPHKSRPHRLTILAVIGLVIGMFAIALNAIWIPSVIHWFGHARVDPPPPPPQSPTSAPAQNPRPIPKLTPLDGEVLGKTGLDAADRKVVISYIRAQFGGRSHGQGLTTDRLSVVDILLQERGEEILGASQHPLDPGEASECILLCDDAIENVAGRRQWVMRISTRRGELRAVELPGMRDDLVEFTFDDGKKISARGSSFFGASYTDESGTQRVASAVLDKIVEQMRKRLNGNPSVPIYAAALVEEARSIDASEVTSSWVIDASVTRTGMGKGTIEIMWHNLDHWWIDPAGRVLRNPRLGTDPDTFQWKPMGRVVRFRSPGLTRLQISTVLLDLLASIALWFLLLAACRLMLDDNPLGRWLAWRYAWCAIALALVRFALSAWYGFDLYYHLNLFRPIPDTIATINLTALAIGLILPVTMLLTLQSHAVKQFYGSTEDEPQRL